MNKREMKRAKKVFLKKEDTEGKWQKWEECCLFKVGLTCFYSVS